MILRCLAALLAVFTLAVPASAAEPVLNKEGFWGVAAGDTGCFAQMVVEGGDLITLVGKDGEIELAVSARKLKRGKAGKLQTDTVSFEFTPVYSGKDLMFVDGPLRDEALAELRKGKELVVIVDDRVVLGASFEGTGFPGALDAVTACSRGESGWWGKGHVRPADAPGKPVFNKEGLWAISTGSPGICFLQADVGGGVQLQFPTALGQTGVAVSSLGDLPRGSKGRIETDSFRVDFRASYGGRSYFNSDDPLDSASIFALRRARTIRVSVDGRMVVDATLDGSGFAEALDAVAACSKSEAGWWGAGAEKPKP